MLKFKFLCIFIFLIFNYTISFSDSLIVYTPPSTRDIMEEICNIFQKENNIEIKCSYACASILARQIVNGAKADVFISSNKKWMNYVKERNLLDNKTITPLLSSKLVLITSNLNKSYLKIEKGCKIHNFFQGRIAMADPDYAPAGIYAKESLIYYDFWKNVKSRLATVNNVRMALKLVESGECECGIVLNSDTINSKNIKICGNFDDFSHSKIEFLVASLKNRNNKINKFMNFLQSEKAEKIYLKSGFEKL